MMITAPPFIKPEHCELALLTRDVFRANLSGRLLGTSSYTYLLRHYLYKLPKWIMKGSWRCCGGAFQITGKLQLQRGRAVKGARKRRLSEVSRITPSQSNGAVCAAVSGSINNTVCIFKLLNRHLLLWSSNLSLCKSSGCATVCED